MKTLKLNIKERLVALGIFNNPENKVATSELKGYLEDAAQFNITAEDKEAVQWEDIKDDKDVIVSFKFEEKDTEPKEVEISDFTAKYLLEKLESLESSAADQLALSIISLSEQLKV